MARTVTGEELAPNTEIQGAIAFLCLQVWAIVRLRTEQKHPAPGGQPRSCWLSPNCRKNAALRWSNVPFSKVLISYSAPTQPRRTTHPATATNPTGSWWKFGFPVFYITDILQIVEALVALGYGADPRLANALQLVRQKQNAQGRWALEFDYPGKTWANYSPRDAPNKWVTWRALKVLKEVG